MKPPSECICCCVREANAELPPEQREVTCVYPLAAALISSPERVAAMLCPQHLGALAGLVGAAVRVTGAGAKSAVELASKPPAGGPAGSNLN